MYNVNHSRSKFKVYTPVQVVAGSGIDSGKIGYVCSHFSNDDGYEMRLKSKGWIPVKTLKGEYFYMAPGRLRIRTDEEVNKSIQEGLKA